MDGDIQVDSEPKIGTKFTFKVKVGNYSCQENISLKEEYNM